MQIHGTDAIMTTPPRRGRPPTGRKETLQVSIEPEDMQVIDDAGATLGQTRSEIGRALIKGEMTWAEVVKAAKKGRR